MYVQGMTLQRARVWLDHLQCERRANGTHPQLELDIKALSDHIEHLEQVAANRRRADESTALAAWEAAKIRDDELSMYMAGQKLAAALKERG